MLIFLYRNAAGIESEKTLEIWREDSRYLQGYCSLSNMPKTYRKDRVVSFLQGEDLLLGDKAPPAPEPAPKLVSDDRPQVLFTGFKAAARNELEQIAADHGLRVVKTSTKNLSFLCAGSNAGPVKIKKAYEAGAFILTSEELTNMLETGEVAC